MALRKTEHLNEIFRLLSEQRELLKHLPYSSEQIRKDKEISARIRELIDIDNNAVSPALHDLSCKPTSDEPDHDPR